MKIAANNLPMPGMIAERFEPRTRRSAGGDFRFRNTPDPLNKRRSWLLTWQQVPSATADAVWQHYREHSVGTFTWFVPRTAELIPVRWVTPPAFSWTSPQQVTVTAEIEQAEAFE